MRRNLPSLKKARYYFWRQCRQERFLSERHMFQWNQFFLLDLHRTAEASLQGAFFVLDWIKEGFKKAALPWEPGLEPLLEQLRRNPNLLMDARCALIETLLLAGMAGASVKWLEMRCHTSTLAKAESKLNSRVARLWKAYYYYAICTDQEIWLS